MTLEHVKQHYIFFPSRDDAKSVARKMNRAAVCAEFSNGRAVWTSAMTHCCTDLPLET